MSELTIKTGNDLATEIAFLMVQLFSKSDVKEISPYGADLYQHDLLDNRRDTLEPKVDRAIESLSAAKSIPKMKTVFKGLPLPVKYFVFERFLVSCHAFQYLGEDCLEVPAETPLLLRETMLRFWRSCRKNGTVEKLLTLFFEDKLPPLLPHL